MSSLRVRSSSSCSLLRRSVPMRTYAPRGAAQNVGLRTITSSNNEQMPRGQAQEACPRDGFMRSNHRGGMTGPLRSRVRSRLIRLRTRVDRIPPAVQFHGGGPGVLRGHVPLQHVENSNEVAVGRRASELDCDPVALLVVPAQLRVELLQRARESDGRSIPSRPSASYGLDTGCSGESGQRAASRRSPPGSHRPSTLRAGTTRPRNSPGRQARQYARSTFRAERSAGP
jgi:hypothetical protein